MIRIHDLSLAPDEDMTHLCRKAASALRVSEGEITRLDIRKKSIDARKKNDVRVIYTVDAQVKGSERSILHKMKSKNVGQAKDEFYKIPLPASNPKHRPVVVGFGPAGIFAALTLAQAGLCPIVLERGGDVDRRMAAVQTFWQGGRLNPECNVQFGEGGAGTFSDGKLTTGTKNLRIGWVLEQFAAAGAGGEVLYDAKPHIGTDILPTVVKNLRERICELGGEVRFNTKLMGFLRDGDRICGVKAACGGTEQTILCDRVILAIGHSARDTLEYLLDAQIPMEPKPFSMGVRIEHPQKNISDAQYGAAAAHLPPADYKLNVRLPDGGSAYTFCMCPGGEVVAAASEEGGVVTNGMSRSRRDGENANAALLVTLTPADFPDKSTLGGMYWQREIERAAFRAGGENYHAPAQLLGDFLAAKVSADLRSVRPTYRPAVTLCDLHSVLPSRITSVLEQAIPALGVKMHGFDDPDAVLTAPETRSSSPVRIVRDESRQSALRGLYPCGEGAGYAGGIMSAAVDGILSAEEIIKSL